MKLLMLKLTNKFWWYELYMESTTGKGYKCNCDECFKRANRRANRLVDVAIICIFAVGVVVWV